MIKIIWDELKCEFVVVPLSVERPEETIKFKLIFIYINNITKEEVIKIHATKIGPTSIKVLILYGRQVLRAPAYQTLSEP